jgi:hypothetical protein
MAKQINKGPSPVVNEPEEALVPPAAQVTLLKPIQAFNETLTEIKFRLPTAADILQVGGSPVEFDPISSPPRVTHPPQYMTAMISRLGNIPTGSVLKMDTRDWTACAWAISPFFLPNLGQI